MHVHVYPYRIGTLVPIPIVSTMDRESISFSGAE